MSSCGPRPAHLSRAAVIGAHARLPQPRDCERRVDHAVETDGDDRIVRVAQRRPPTGARQLAGARFLYGRGPLVLQRAADGRIARVIRAPVHAAPTLPAALLLPSGIGLLLRAGNQGPDRTRSSRALARSVLPRRRRRGGYAYATLPIRRTESTARSHSIAAPAELSREWQAQTAVRELAALLSLDRREPGLAEGARSRAAWSRGRGAVGLGWAHPTARRVRHSTAVVGAADLG
jgi:hypothetical protein